MTVAALCSTRRGTTINLAGSSCLDGKNATLEAQMRCKDHRFVVYGGYKGHGKSDNRKDANG